MRRKIWHIADYQCAIVGTCLSHKELLKLARKAKLRIPFDAGEYEVHGTFVYHCRTDNAVSRAVQKHLDKKYSGAIRRFANVVDDAQGHRLWRQALEAGDIPGPFWALVSHARLSDGLRGEAFGDVHMLSHLVGAANRADIRRLRDLEKQLADQEARTAKARAALKKSLRHLAGENRELKGKLTAMAKETEGYKHQAMRAGSAALQAESEGLRRSLATQAQLLSNSEHRRDKLVRRLEAYERHAGDLRADLAERDAEIRLLEDELFRQSATGGCGCDLAGTADCPGPEHCPDLMGRRVLYVGGRTNLVRHYKDVVERRGGVFIHHDGGVEETCAALPGLLGGADMVLCPVDCVSHNACRRVKEVCAYSMKPCAFLRSSGLSSLIKGLEEIVAKPSNQEKTLC